MDSARRDSLLTSQCQRPWHAVLTQLRSLLTGTEPVQIFVERTPSNIVPVHDETISVGVSASIEYAVAVRECRT